MLILSCPFNKIVAGIFPYYFTEVKLWHFSLSIADILIISI